jgi:hypothetical protein
MPASDTAILSQVLEEIYQMKAEVRLLSARLSTPSPEEQWLSLDEAYSKLGIKSKRALQRRIGNGTIPPDCIRSVPSLTQKTALYLINTSLYLSKYAV